MEFDSSSAEELLLILEQNSLHAAKVVYVGGLQLWRNSREMCKSTPPGLNPGCQIGEKMSQIRRDESSTIQGGLASSPSPLQRPHLCGGFTVTASQCFLYFQSCMHACQVYVRIPEIWINR